MSDVNLLGSQARRKRLSSSLANQQAAFLGQLRGTRNLADITRQGTENYRPTQASFGRRGFGGPNVSSGIRRAGLARYAETLQRQLGRETEDMQNELNAIAARDAAEQADLESYLNELRLSKAQDIMATAAQLRDFGGY